MTPAIAVLMPVYKPGAEIAASIGSLRAQTLPFRLFIVDDGSPLAFDYEAAVRGLDARIIRLPKNLGITGALNAGLAEILNGNIGYIARLDSGDVCLPHRFARQKTYLDAHKDISIVGSAVKLSIVDGAGREVDARTIQFPAKPADALDRLWFNSPVSHPAIMMRRQVFERIGLYSEDYRAAEDYDLMWRAAQAGLSISNIEDVLLIKEETPHSISHQQARRQVTSRLLIQWANRNLMSPRSLVGLAKSVITLATPRDFLSAIKRLNK